MRGALQFSSGIPPARPIQSSGLSDRGVNPPISYAQMFRRATAVDPVPAGEIPRIRALLGLLDATQLKAAWRLGRDGIC